MNSQDGKGAIIHGRGNQGPDHAAGEPADRGGRTELRREWYAQYVKGQNGVANSGKSGIINQASKRDGVQDVRQVCKLDPKLYHCVTNDIATDEVVMTEKQIEHIKERHPNDYEICEKWAGAIIQDPDYIIKSEKPSTAIVLRQIEENGKQYRLVLRLKTSKDLEDYKNSIITFQKVKEKEWRRLLRKVNVKKKLHILKIRYNTLHNGPMEKSLTLPQAHQRSYSD